MSDHYLTVRDHTQPCEHLESFQKVDDTFGMETAAFKGHSLVDGWCPGGRAIVLRKTRPSEWHPRFDDMQELWVVVLDE
jgi:hypothetical protein